MPRRLVSDIEKAARVRMCVGILLPDRVEQAFEVLVHYGVILLPEFTAGVIYRF